MHKTKTVRENTYVRLSEDKGLHSTCFRLLFKEKQLKAIAVWIENYSYQ